MKLLITGREGQLARSLAEVMTGHSALQTAFAGRPELDLEQPGSFDEAVNRYRPDVVINTAACTAVDQAEAEPDRAMRINGDAAGEGAAAASTIGARFIQISTDYVFDGRSSAVLREDAQVGPLSVYGRTKLAGEEQVRRAAADHVIIRTSWVVSPFGRNFVRTMMKAAQERPVLTVVDDQCGCPTSALDLARGLLALVEGWSGGGRAGLGETFHLAGTGATSWCGLAAFVMDRCRELGLPVAEVRPIRTADWPTPAARPMSTVLDSSKFAREVGFTMRPWQTSVAEVVQRLAELQQDGRA